MALLIIPVLKRWSRARGPYGYLRTWNWPITARQISQPYNNCTYWNTIKVTILYYIIFCMICYHLICYDSTISSMLYHMTSCPNILLASDYSSTVIKKIRLYFLKHANYSWNIELYIYSPTQDSYIVIFTAMKAVKTTGSQVLLPQMASVHNQPYGKKPIVSLMVKNKPQEIGLFLWERLLKLPKQWQIV